jgi:hypothetical protein
MTQELKALTFPEVANDEPFALTKKAQVWYTKLGPDTFDKQSAERKAEPGVVHPRDFRVRNPENKLVYVKVGKNTYRVNYTGIDTTNHQRVNGFMIMENCESAIDAQSGAWDALLKRAGIKDPVITHATYLHPTPPKEE